MNVFQKVKKMFKVFLKVFLKVQVYISQVFVEQLRQMDVFWKMQERAFSRKTIVNSTSQDHKKTFFLKSFFLNFPEDYNEGGFSSQKRAI